MQNLWDILQETFQQWTSDNVGQLAAALAFYLTFSLAPILVITIALAGFFFGETAAEGEIVAQTEDFLGTETAEAIQTFIVGVDDRPSGTFATITGVGFLILTSLRFFNQLQGALNQIWHVQPKYDSWLNWYMVRKRLISFMVVLTLGVLLIVVMLVNSTLPVIYGLLYDVVPSVQMLSQAISTIITIVMMILFFAIVYKILPDVQIAWQDVWVGATATAVLIFIGNILISFYLRHSSTTSYFGAAGSFIALMLWIYYSSMVAFFGAEFTQVYADARGREIKPDRHTVSTETQSARKPELSPNA